MHPVKNGRITLVRGPVQGLVGRYVRSAHNIQLPRWIHKMNPFGPFVQQSPANPSAGRVKIRSARETRQPYPSSSGISFAVASGARTDGAATGNSLRPMTDMAHELRDLRRVNNALICQTIQPSPAFSDSSSPAFCPGFFRLPIKVPWGSTPVSRLLP